MPSPNPEERRRQVFEELKPARAEFIQMENAVAEIVRDAPSGIPLTDEQTRIVRAGAALKLAFEKYQKAVEDYRKFSRSGDISDGQ